MIKKAEDFFIDGCNCSQSIVLAYAKQTGLDFKTAKKISEPFGGGVGRMRHICGALSGALMIAGLKCASDEISKESKDAVYELTQKIAKEFKEKNGSIICAEILKLQKEKPEMFSSVSEERTADYYKNRPCLKVIENCRKILDEVLEKNI